MPSIQILNEQITNLIAAGEVVERPANVVKECVENSVDAHAQVIDIDIEQGGIGRIVITDDGDGMDPQDAALSFMRHATSKLKTESDLFDIQTMGFRGEALASIASVAHVEMETNDTRHCTRIVYDYGTCVKKEECSCPKGTRIDVSGLFVKTPARFKHLK
ncbi:MAG: ATP-binding protein, partial [Erysipelotrichaceae bacterium]|nr:ATP-binding protein [Erysipelotrichaceae bacterium]